MRMKKYIILAAAAIALAACNNDDNYVDEPIVAQISAYISTTRASGSSWAAGDSIGITMGERYHNIKYTTEGNGNFTGNTMYFKNKRESLTLTAYYPFTGSEGTAPGIIEVDTRADNQTKDIQPKIDFLYAVNENVKATEPQVQFTFNHKMSKITFIFKNGNDGTDVGKIKSYSISGLAMDGTFNTATGVCATKDEAQAEILSISLADGSVKDGEVIPPVIICPQTVGSDTVTLNIVDSEEQEYSCKLNFKNNALVAGDNYQWIITVSKTGLVVGEPTINNWEDQNSDAGAGSVLPQN